MADLALVRRARKIYRALEKKFPYAHAELDFSNPFELLVATVLSAQTTDVRVNMVTPELFRRYPTPEALASASQEEVSNIIRSTGFYKVKSKNIIALAQKLCTDFNGEVPQTIDELTTLPGVGRKTANVVLGNAFGKAGLTVDTHFARLSRRLEFTNSKDPLIIEKDVAELFPQKQWTMLSHLLIFQGRRICHARKPACGACPIAQLCPSYGEGETNPIKAAKLLKYELAPQTTTTSS
ncbi:MAG: endonuclease III [Micrococcaceae bacterium]